MNREFLFSAVGGIGDDLIAGTGERLGLLDRTSSSVSAGIQEVKMDNRKVKSFSKTLVIAAAVTALLAATALAAVIFGTKVQPAEGVTGHWNGHTVNFDDAKLYVTFESTAPRHEYQFKANWLPSTPTWGSAGVFTEYISNDGEGDVLPYQVNAYTHLDLQGVRYCFDGKETLVRQDTWKGYERTEVVLDYTGTHHSFKTANYLLLFQPEDNYLIYIAGTDSMKTLEKIADNLEIRLGDVITEPQEGGEDVAWFDLGRG